MTRSKKRVISLILTVVVMLAFTITALAYTGTAIVKPQPTNTNVWIGQYSINTAVVAGIQSNSANAGLDIEVISPNGQYVAYTSYTSTLPTVAGTAKATGAHTMFIYNAIGPQTTVTYYSNC